MSSILQKIALPDRFDAIETGGGRLGSVAIRTTIVALALAVLGLAGRILSYPVQDDEHIHIAAGVLMSRHGLYGELDFIHLPNFPLMLGALFELTGTESYVLAGRFLVCAFWLAAGLALALIAWRLTRSAAMTLVALLLLVTNVLLLERAAMLVTNSFPPVPFALLAFYTFLIGASGDRPRPFAMAAAGMCIAIAIGFKVNYVFLVPPFLLAALFVPRELSLRQRLLFSVLPAIAGGLVAALPTLYFLLDDPQSFLAHTYRYFTVAHRAYWLLLDEPKAMSIADKILIAERVWLSGATLLAACLAVFAMFVPSVTRGATVGPLPRAVSWALVLAFSLALLGALVSFIPTPAFSQYYSPPVVFVIVCAILLYGALNDGERRITAPLLVSVAVLATVAGASRLLPGIPALFQPSQWTGVSVHRQARQMAAKVGGEHAKVATLWPIHVLEGGRQIYPEFAGGPFLYRVAHLIPASDRKHYRMPSQDELGRFLDAAPPQAVLVDMTGRSDESLAFYAASRGYHRVPVEGDPHLMLFLREAR